MLHILIGVDEFSRQQAVEEIEKGIGDPAMLAANTTVLEGQQLTVNELRATGEAMPFFGAKRLVIVNGLLERFAPKIKPARKTVRSPKQADDPKPFAEEIKKMPESTVMVLVDGDIKESNPLLKELSAKAEVRSFPALKRDELRRWIQKRVAEQGSTVSPTAVELLARLVGGDLWAVSNEINKLVLFAAGRRIEELDVKSVVSYEQQTTVFAMVDAILECRADVAEPALQQLLEKGDNPGHLMAMLERQAQFLVRAKDMKNEKKTRVEIQNRLGLADFALRKTLEQADRYTMPRLKELYGRLLEADLGIKTGRYDNSELALNILVAELCQAPKVTAGTRPEGGL